VIWILPAMAFVLLLAGCQAEAANLRETEFKQWHIESGGTAILQVNAENKGSTTINGFFRVTPIIDPRFSDLVSISHSGRKEFNLDPGETTGRELYYVTVESISGEMVYKFQVEFINKDTGKVLDKSIEEIKVG